MDESPGVVLRTLHTRSLVHDLRPTPPFPHTILYNLLRLLLSATRHPQDKMACRSQLEQKRSLTGCLPLPPTVALLGNEPKLRALTNGCLL
jgi:hypothetical protein